MPSGAKKRKAAKKKKENPTDNHHPNASSVSSHAHGGDDLKRHDDKEIDAGEVRSPASQDHHSNKNSLTEGEEEEIEGGESVSNPPSVEGVRIEVADTRNIVVEDESVVPVEREFKIEDESDKKDKKFEHDDGGSSGSSSSSSGSDDESRGIKSSQAVVDATPVLDSIEVADSSSIKKAEAIHSTTLDSAAGPSIIESVLMDNGEKKLSFVDDKVGVPEAFKDAAPQREEAIIQSVEKIVAIPDTKDCVAQESDGRLTTSTDASVATADNGSNTEKDSGVTQPLLAPAPHSAQRTSWKSCCGLFEVFAGSDR